MRQVVRSRPIEVALGSGLALSATVTTFGNPKIESEVEVMTDSTDLAATIVTVIGLAVV